MYHDPEFQAELEAYHAAALRAHNRADRSTIPLPMAPVPEPVAVPAAARYGSSYATNGGTPNGGPAVGDATNGDEPQLLSLEPDRALEAEDPPQLLRAEPDPPDEPPANGNAAKKD